MVTNDLTRRHIERGHAVEFISDLQTDKGPCTGHIEIIQGNNVCMHISDGVEWFKRDKLQLERRSRRAKDDLTLWIFK